MEGEQMGVASFAEGKQELQLGCMVVRHAVVGVDEVLVVTFKEHGFHPFDARQTRSLVGERVW